MIDLYCTSLWQMWPDFEFKASLKRFSLFLIPDFYKDAVLVSSLMHSAGPDDARYKLFVSFEVK